MNKGKLSRGMLFVVILLFVMPSIASAQTQDLPDLVLKEVACGSGNKLLFTVANIGAALPSGWASVANVHFDGAFMGTVDLGRPTSGDLTPSGGSASYLVAFDIARSVEVKIAVDSTNSITEANEGNNAMVTKVSPCEVVQTPAPTQTQPAQVKFPDLVVKEIKCSGGKLFFTAANIGGPMPAGWWSNAAVYFDGVHMGNVALERPTSGDLTSSGGAASYQTDFEITRTVKVEISVDASASITELNEGNNYMYAPVEPCGAATATAITQDKQPDLVVKEIKCSGGRLFFTAANIGGPMPAGWWSNAAVYFDGVHMGNIALQNPTTGDLTPSGGFATYLTDFEITRTVKVEISVDASASVPEVNEGNNYMYSPVAPCEVVQVGEKTPVPTIDPVLQCIEKYQKLEGLSYEEAKKRCTAVSQTPQPAGGCIEKYMDVFGISYEEAKKRCEAGRSIAVPAVVINRCDELDKRLNILIDKLNAAQGQDVELLKKEIEALKIELKGCEAKVPQVTKEVTPGIKNPCDEVKILKESLAQLTKKIAYIEELVVKGEMNKGDLEPYYRERSYLEERLEKMSFACQQGRIVEESPCARLSKLEIIYKEINDKLQGIKDEKSRSELNDKLASVAREITALKQRCGAENLVAMNIESLSDIESAYRAKQKIAVTGASEENLMAELAKIEDEKKKLLLEFAQRLVALDARQTTLIKKFEIKNGKVILDGINTMASKVKVEVKDKDIEIEPSDTGAAIIDGGTRARGDVPLEYADGMLRSTKSGKEIKVMPSALLKDVEGLDYVKIDDEVTWLPATILFQSTGVIDPDPPLIKLPRGTKVEKSGAGYFKFLLPDGRAVEIRNYDATTGIIGDTGIFDQKGNAVATGLKGSLLGARKPERIAAALAPSILRDLTLIDDGKPEYLAETEKRGRLLGFIPITVRREIRISAESGAVIDVEAPWWDAITVHDPDPPLSQ